MKILPLFIRRRIAHRPNLLKAVDNIGWLFIDKILRMGVGLLVSVWLARYLGPQQFGQFSFATAFVGLFGAVAGLGLQSIVVRDLVRDPAGKEETLGTAALLQLGGGLLAYGLILGTFIWLRPNDLLGKWIVSVLGSAVLFKASDVAVYWFESQVSSKYTVWVQNGSFLVFASVKVALILGNAPILAFAWAVMAEAAAVALLLPAILGLRGLGKLRLKMSMARAKALMSESWPLLLSSLAVLAYMKIGQIMIGQMLGDEDVGIYSAATRISEIWYFIPVMIVASVSPSLLETKRQSEALYYARLQQIYDVMAWLSIAVAIPITFLASPIITALFGDSYQESGAVLATHIWASIFVFWGVASSTWFLAEGKQLLSLQRTVLGLIVNVLVNYILIPRYGPIGAASAAVVANAVAAYLFDLARPETRNMFNMKTRSLNITRIFMKRKRSMQ